MRPVERTVPQALRADLQLPLSANESPISPAAAMFRLGLLLKGLASGCLPLASSRERNCSLSPGIAVNRARSIAKKHRQLQVCLATL